jgi:hypothetical protein|nr:MAG TPA: hypothetical protein [Caudoviricetes sp.]
MDKGRGVIYINYVDDNVASGMMCHSVNIFFNVYEASFLGDANMVSITQTFGEDDDLYSKTTYIPLSNIGLLEKFDTMEDFYKEYPQIKEMKGE